MPARRLYAVHFPRRGSGSPRLYRFHASSLRALRMGDDPSRWRVPPAGAAQRLATRADARRCWRYEGPGAWSTGLGALRAAWWRFRL